LERILSATLWTALTKASKAAGRRYAAVAYVTTGDYVAFRAGDVLVVDASDDAIVSRKTSRSLLNELSKKRVSIASVPGLHAKMIAFKSELFVGSMNFSLNSPKLTEAAFHTQDSSAIAEARQLVEQLWALGDEVDGDFLKRIAKLDLASSKPFKTPPRRAERPPRVWLVSTYDYSSAAKAEREDEKGAAGTKEAARFVTKGYETNFLVYGEKARVSIVRNVRAGDQIILLYRTKTGAYQVYRDNFAIFIKKPTGSVHLHYRSIANEKALPWSRFLKLWKAAGGGHVTGKSTRLVNDIIARKLLAKWN
jgi:hypothetical protein